MQKQLEDAKEAIKAASEGANAALEAQIKLARAEAEQGKDDLATFQKMLAESQEAFAADIEGTKAAHKRELDELAAGHSGALSKAQATHEEGLAKVNTERANLRSELEDEREAKERALALVQDLNDKLAAAAVPAPAPKPAVTGVSKEELEKLHQAHNATLVSLEADHAKALQGLKDSLAEKEAAVESAEAETSRKAMEISYMAADKEETDSEVERCVSFFFSCVNQPKLMVILCRLKEDLSRVTEELAALKAQAA